MGPRNTLIDLNNHLFAQIERLGDEELKGESLQEELGRAKAVAEVATRIVSNASLMLQAADRLGAAYTKERSGELQRLFLPSHEG